MRSCVQPHEQQADEQALSAPPAAPAHPCARRGERHAPGARAQSCGTSARSGPRPPGPWARARACCCCRGARRSRCVSCAAPRLRAACARCWPARPAPRSAWSAWRLQRPRLCAPFQLLHACRRSSWGCWLRPCSLYPASYKSLFSVSSFVRVPTLCVQLRTSPARPALLSSTPVHAVRQCPSAARQCADVAAAQGKGRLDVRHGPDSGMPAGVLAAVRVAGPAGVSGPHRRQSPCHMDPHTLAVAPAGVGAAARGAAGACQPDAPGASSHPYPPRPGVPGQSAACARVDSRTRQALGGDRGWHGPPAGPLAGRAAPVPAASEATWLPASAYQHLGVHSAPPRPVDGPLVGRAPAGQQACWAGAPNGVGEGTVLRANTLLAPSAIWAPPPVMAEAAPCIGLQTTRAACRMPAGYQQAAANGPSDMPAGACGSTAGGSAMGPCRVSGGRRATQAHCSPGAPGAACLSPASFFSGGRPPDFSVPLDYGAMAADAVRFAAACEARGAGAGVPGSLAAAHPVRGDAQRQPLQGKGVGRGAAAKAGVRATGLRSGGKRVHAGQQHQPLRLGRSQLTREAAGGAQGGSKRRRQQ